MMKHWRARFIAMVVLSAYFLCRRYRRYLAGHGIDRIFALWSYRRGGHFSLGWHDARTAAVGDNDVDVDPASAWETLQRVVGAMERLRRLVMRGETSRLAESEITWEEEDFIVRDGVRIRHGTFTSTATDLDSIMHAVLPVPSRQAHFEIVLPQLRGDQGGSRCPMVVHLAASGEEGYTSRRSKLALPLACEHGVGSVILENAMYGRRAPRGPNGAPAHSLPGRASGAATMPTVAELLSMGLCTVAEALALLSWLRGRGHARLCVSGISMGGEMATLVAACAQQEPVACAAFLPCHNTAAVFCEGVMAGSCDYGALARLSAAQGFCASATSAAAPSALGCVGANRQILAITDIRSLPPPRCPAACILVAAEDDGYVPPYSARLIHAHWQGSELRWVPGGHCSAFVKQQPTFLRSLTDALAALGPAAGGAEQPAPGVSTAASSAAATALPAAVPLPPGYRIRCISAAAALPPPPSTPLAPHFADSFFRPQGNNAGGSGRDGNSSSVGGSTTAGADATELSDETASALAAISLDALVAHGFGFVATAEQRAERLAGARASLLDAARVAMACGSCDTNSCSPSSSSSSSSSSSNGEKAKEEQAATALWVLEARSVDLCRCKAAAARGADGPWDAVGCCGLVDHGVDTATTACAGRVAELRGLYVHADHRRQQLGHCLLRLAERFAVAAGYDSVWLETSRRMTAARALYVSNGYAVVRSLHNKWEDDIMLKVFRHSM